MLCVSAAPMNSLLSARTFSFCSTTNHCTYCTTSGWAGIPNVWILAPPSPGELRSLKHSPPPILSITKPHRVPDAQHSASNHYGVYKSGCIILTQTWCLKGTFFQRPSDYMTRNNLFQQETLRVPLNPAAFHWPHCIMQVCLCLFACFPPWHDVCVWVWQLLLVCYHVCSYLTKKTKQKKTKRLRT